jgi:antitoxin HicB
MALQAILDTFLRKELAAGAKRFPDEFYQHIFRLRGWEWKGRDHMKKKGRIGSSFDDFLKEDGIYEEVTARAIKRVIARQLDALMEDQGLTKSELAKRMKTSRAQLDRLLDPENESVTLGTLTRAAKAVGRHLRMELV